SLPNHVPGGADLNNFENQADVAALRNGAFVVVWSDANSVGVDTDIRASILTASGQTIASNILVNTTIPGAQNAPNVVGLNDGGFLVTWEDDNADLVRAQRFDSLGQKIGSEFTVKSGVGTDSPQAAALTDGRIAFALGDVSSGDADVTTSIW